MSEEIVGQSMPIVPAPVRKASEDTIIFKGVTPTVLDEKDAIHRAIEGLKYAASQARELNKRQPGIWNGVRESLSAMINSVRMLAAKKAENRQVIEHKLDSISREISNG